jgi:hypothetical protein
MPKCMMRLTLRSNVKLKSGSPSIPASFTEMKRTNLPTKTEIEEATKSVFLINMQTAGMGTNS